MWGGGRRVWGGGRDDGVRDGVSLCHLYSACSLRSPPPMESCCSERRPRPLVAMAAKS